MSKVMLVEDDENLREIYSIRLTAEGYTIVTAHDGEEALAVAVKERPDLIVSDVMMPKISGFDMLDILRSTPEIKDIKVIMMTALSSEEERQRGERLGANRYLVKSQVGIEDVVNAVHEVLGDVSGGVINPGVDNNVVAAQPAAATEAMMAQTDRQAADAAVVAPAATPSPEAVAEPQDLVIPEPMIAAESATPVAAPSTPTDTPVVDVPSMSTAAPVVSSTPTPSVSTDTTVITATPAMAAAPAASSVAASVVPQVTTPTVPVASVTPEQASPVPEPQPATMLVQPSPETPLPQPAAMPAQPASETPLQRSPASPVPPVPPVV